MANNFSRENSSDRHERNCIIAGCTLQSQEKYDHELTRFYADVSATTVAIDELELVQKIK